MKKTKIEWCDSTWNPVTGCLHTCEYCYARNMAHRFGGSIETAPDGGIHELTGPFYADKPGQENIANRFCAYPYGFAPTLHRYRLDIPEQWTKSRNIFVCSMADLFGDWAPDEWIIDVLATCRKAPQHIYLFLTKNPKAYRRIESLNIEYQPNWWLGTSATNSASFLDNAFDLWQSTEGIPNAKRFLSVEPLLGAVDPNLVDVVGRFHWLILGAETGHRPGKVTPKKKWVTALTEACDRMDVPVFMKNSLIPIVGEENMRREFPPEMQAGDGRHV